MSVTDPLADLIAASRARIDRFEPAAVPGAQAVGYVVLDIRTADQRRRLGVVPGSLWYPRNVLEWRCAPSSDHCDPAVRDAGYRVILMCMHGFQTSLAAATLRDLGCVGASDLIGGFEGWAEAGLPVEPYDETAHGLQGSDRARVRDY